MNSLPGIAPGSHAGSRGRALARLAAMVVALAFLTQACSPATITPSPSGGPPGGSPGATEPASDPSAVPTATLTPLSGEPSISGDAYLDMPVNLEMTVDCVFCDVEGLLARLPRFRLYADGVAVFREADEAASPYRYIQLGDGDFEELLRYALDEGGLRGAEPSYPSNADDVGGFQLALHAQFLDDGADVDVHISPLIEDGGLVDTEGRPIEDLARRERLLALADLLGHFDRWLEARGQAGAPYVPESYTVAIVAQSSGDGDAPWPWDDITPEDFAAADSLVRLARITPEQAAQAGAGLGGGVLPNRSLGDGGVATLLIRPVLPGDDRPGSFGLRPDTVAIVGSDGLRVRSLPEVSDASTKLSPLLGAGDALYVIDGPVAGSGYNWYEVHAPQTGLTGWVAAADKSGEDWIRPVPLACTLGASPEAIIDALGYELMHLACYKGVVFGDVRFLGRPEDDGLRCPDVREWWSEPDWLNHGLSCSYEFRPVEFDTGSYDLVSGGVLVPSIADVPESLLAANPDGLLVEVVGNIDHPESRDCQAVGDNPPAPALARLYCRYVFVITDLRPAS